MYIKVLTVSAINNYIKKVADSDFILKNASIKGEISNFKIHSSGHIYFSLKDEYSKINCIMFKNNAEAVKFVPKDGMKIIANGRISVYEKEGTFQLYCNDIKLEGIGELYVAFNELKEKLQSKGLFDESHKIDLPVLPRRIGVITSPTGAAVNDIINVTRRRNKNVDLLICPVLVQGVGASEDIINAFRILNNINDIDIIILARGGGSLEELWAFNDEKLAYAIYKSKKPVITGVGHETDFTIADFVSDRRAPTPSAAAEIAVPDINNLNNMLINYNKNLQFKMKNILDFHYNKMNALEKSLMLKTPMNYITNKYVYIDNIKEKLRYVIDTKIDMRKEKLSNLNSLLSAHNPLNILNRGYSIIQDESGNIISEINTLKSTNKVKITLKDGSIEAGLHCDKVKE